MDKLKKALKELSTQEEIDRMDELDLQKEFSKKLASTEESLEILKKGLVMLANHSKESGNKISSSVKDNMGNFVDKLVEKLEEVKGTISTSFERNKPFNAAGVYKDMINQLSAIDTSIKSKPVPVWNWPQYASVGVRDKSFSNIDPSLAYAHNTTTVGTPYGTTLAWDSSGTIKVVSTSNPLPVTASVTITSVSQSGLKVDLSKFSLGTPALSGLQVVLNGSNATIPVSISGNQSVNIAAATTSVLAGIRTYINNPSGAQAVNIQDGGNSITVDGSVTVSATDLDIRNLVFATDKIDTSGSTLAANSGVDIGDVTINNASGGSAVNIQDGGNSITVDGTVTSTIASTSISGLSVSLKTLTSSGLKVVLNGAKSGTTASLSGLQVVLNGNSKPTAITTTVPGLSVNLVRATTSVLSGIKVSIKNDNNPLVTTSVIGIAAALSGDNIVIGKQGAGKRIHVYAWNLSFSGTVNAKFSDGAAGSKLLAGLIYGVANAGGGNSVTPNLSMLIPEPVLFRVSANKNLYLNLSGATAVGGSISYYVL